MTEAYELDDICSLCDGIGMIEENEIELEGDCE